MTDTRRFLAFDLGAESGRGIVGTLSAGTLALQEIHRFPNGGIRINQHLHWNAFRLFAHMLEGLRIYGRDFGPDLDGLGVDTWGVDFGLLDARGVLVGNPYHYRDSRTERSADVIDEKLGNRALYDLTGIQLLPFNTVNQLTAMAASSDPVLSISDTLLFMADLFHYFFTGRKVVEYTLASISQLYNPMTHTWERRVFDALSIPFRIGADIIRAGDIVGELNPQIAGEAGLAETHVIAPAVHDTASAAAAVPTERESGWAFLSSGTWSIVGLELDAPIINDQSYAMNISNSGGACDKNLYLKNVMGLWIMQCCKRIWNLRDASIDYPMIVERAAQAPSLYAYIDPDHAMFVDPPNAPEQVAAFCRETGQQTVDPHDIGLVSRIIFESLAFAYRAVLERLMAATNRDVEVLHIIGGGGQNELLNQFTANVLGKRVTAGPTEATAIGNILIQAIGAGVYSSLPEIRRVITTSFPVKQYTPEHAEQWNSEYGRFLGILEHSVNT